VITSTSRAPVPLACASSRAARSVVHCWTCRQFVLAADVPGLAFRQLRWQEGCDGVSLADP